MSMKKQQIRKTPYHSLRLRSLAQGCKQCVRGEKGVLYITGVCERNCSFCPTADEKKNADVMFINEQQITTTSFAKQWNTIRVELDRQGARGIGITGGNPLLRLKRTTSHIKKLKATYGPTFHIHLYTTLTPLTSRDKLSALYRAGLDEIRFHPDLDSSEQWHILEEIIDSRWKWDVGIEIPLLPDKKKQTRALLDYFSPLVDFINLNELEMADNSFTDFSELGYHCKDDSSYAVKKSFELGVDCLIRQEKKKETPKVHLCTAELKNTVQLGNRIKRTAHHTKQAHDIVTPDGMLRRGAIYHPDCTPSFSYKKTLQQLSSAKRRRIEQELSTFYQELCLSNPESADQFTFDSAMLRILTHPALAKRMGKTIAPLKAAEIIEYPTSDHLLLEVTFF